MKKIRLLTEADVTAESAFFMQRRQVLKALGISAAALSLPSTAQADLFSWFKGNDRPKAPAGKPLEFSQPAAWRSDLALTPEDKVTGYNNFYEFGLDKADPAANAGSLKTEPWTLKISGEVAKPFTLDYDDLTHRFPLEERIYRMRCVEGYPWSCRGLVSLYISYSRRHSPPATLNMWHSKRYTRRMICQDRKIVLLAAD